MFNRLIEEVRLDNDISSFKIMEGKLHRLNQMTAEKCRDLGNEIRMEEDDMRGLEWEVLELEQDPGLLLPLVSTPPLPLLHQVAGGVQRVLGTETHDLLDL